MVDIDEPNSYQAIMSVREASIMERALGLWISEDGGYGASSEELAIAQQMRETIAQGYTPEEREVLELTPETAQTPIVIIRGVSGENLTAVADALRENAEYGTEFDAVLHEVAGQLERQVQA
jgi:hypothetical protein